MIWTFNAAWHLLASTFSIATLVGVGAVFIAVLTPAIPQFWPLTKIGSHLRAFAIYVAIGAFSYSTVAGKFYHDGLAVKQAEWDAAKDAEAKNGERARSDAQRDIRDDTPDDVRRDPRNRDNWK
jgi:hypothetical protein